MPARKVRLSRAEQARYLVAAQQLRDAGLPCEIPELSLATSYPLDIVVAPPHENTLRELPNGSVVYAVYARLLARRGGSILESFEIASEWDSALVPLCAKKNGLYSFESAVNFVWGEVLNHRIENGLRFHGRGDLAEGQLLAIGHRPIPEKYKDWMGAPLEVTFTDQFGEDHYVSAMAFVERCQPQRELPAQPKRFQGMLDYSRAEQRIESMR